MQGARRGTQSRDSRVMSQDKGRRQTTEPPRDPQMAVFKLRPRGRGTDARQSLGATNHKFWNPMDFFFNIYLFMRDRERKRERQREKQGPCREPDVELDLGTPGSRPGPKAGAKPLSHPSISEGRGLTDFATWMHQLFRKFL